MKRLRLDGQKVLFIMAERLMSRTDLSEASDVSYRTITSALGGKTVTTTTVGLIARALEVKPEEIATVVSV